MAFSMSIGKGKSRARALAVPAARESAGAEDGTVRELVRAVGADGVESATSGLPTGPLVIPVSSNPWEKGAGAASGINSTGAGRSSTARGSRPPVKAEESVKEEPVAQSAEDLAREAIIAEARGGPRAGSDSLGGSGRVIEMRGGGGDGSGDSAGLLASNMVPGLLDVVGEDARFRHDVSMRAADVDPDSDAYRAVPVEDFGAALLRGMGWAGPAANDSATPAVSEPRHQRLGLGATPKPPEREKKRPRKNGQEPPPQPAQPLPKLTVTNIVSFSVAAAAMAVAGGFRVAERQRAMVLRTQGVGEGMVRVRLEGDGEEIVVPRAGLLPVSDSDVAKRPMEFRRGGNGPGSDKGGGTGAGSNGAGRNGARNNGAGSNGAGAGREPREKSQHKSSNGTNGSATERRGGRGDEDDGRESQGGGSSSKGWVVKGIRVRVVSRSYGSRHDRKKGAVVSFGGEDGDKGATIRMDDGEVIRGVKQRHLETVVPSAGGSVRVLRGAYRGAEAVVLRKDTNGGTGFVEISDRHGKEMELSLDDMAELAT